MSYRLVEKGRDWDAIEAAVAKLKLDAPAYGFSTSPSVDKTLAYIRQHIKAGDAYIVDEAYLLLVGVGEAWHGHEVALEERLVLKLHAGNLLAVPEALKAIASTRGARVIIVSDSSINQRMGNLYKRAGYRAITTTYYKEL